MKKQFFSLVILVLISGVIMAQSGFKKHSVGINVSNDATSIFRNYEIEPEQEFRVQYGYSAAILYQYRPVKWLSIESGIEWNSTAYFLHDDIPYRFFNAMECRSLDCFQTGQYGMRTNRVAVPINLRGHYQVGRVNLYTLMGITLNSSVGGAYISDEHDNERRWFKFNERSFSDGFGLGLSAAIGIEYTLSSKLLLRAEPRFRVYDIVSPSRKTSIYSFIIEHPWTAGLNLGIYYGFGK